MRRIISTGVTLLAASSLAACSGSGNSPQSVTVNNPLSGVLKVGVGTANIYGDLGAAGGAMTGLNLAVTFRQPSGDTLPGGTAALVNTPSLTGPFTNPATAGTPDAFAATILTGPATTEVGKGSITASPQQNPGEPVADIPSSTFGVDGNASGYGVEPFNYTATADGGTNFGNPASYVPYPVPVYDAITAGGGVDSNQSIPWGGPPAFDPHGDGKGTRDNSGYPPGVLGLEDGLDVFEGVTPAAGSYTMTVNVPTGQTTTGNVTQTATLGSTALLPAITVPTVALDGNGGGTFGVTLPAGVTEALIQITDIGPASGVSCNATPVYYSLFATASGTYTLPDGDGPASAGTSQPSLCTSAQNTAQAKATTDGDQFTIQTYGFDYPWYEASYYKTTSTPNPTITGPNGQSDITISSIYVCSQPAGGTLSCAPSATAAATSRLRQFQQSLKAQQKW